MQLHDHMKYLDMGCKMACIPRYQWKGRPTERMLYASEQRIVFLLGTICQIFQIAGVLIYWWCNGRMAKDTGTFVAQLSEMCSSFTLTFVGFCNVYALSVNRKQIETLLEELQELYPRSRNNHYRCRHYFDLAMAIMRIEFLFYMFFYVYYNSAPVLLLLWEHLHEGYDLSYKTQTNTWFPWKVHGSTLGFAMAVLSITLGSFVGVGFSIVTQNLVCLFSFQLKLHYDGISSQLVSLDCRQPGAHQELRILIAYHCRILQLGDQVNSILNFVFGSSLVGATIAICMSSISILLLDFASACKYVSGLVAFVLYNFVICYMGTEVSSAAADTQSYVAEISEATGALMLVAVGFFNICVLSNRRPEIEILLTDLRELYPRPRDRNYRQQYYFGMANGFMKFEFIYFWMFTLYYNTAPLVVMMYEYLVDGMEMRYKTQINTWYPWKVYGSAIGYGVGHFATFISSIEGVAFSLGTHNIICIMTYQLKLHFDAISNQLLKLDSRHPGANQELRRLIAYHSHVIQIADSFNEIMNFSFLGGLFFSTTALCMTSVAILLLDLQSAVKCINGLIAFIVYNFVICFLGTEFTLALPAAAVGSSHHELANQLYLYSWDDGGIIQ
ncbi:putative odorant receptor 69a [Drosophila teissieri]|uniref:putative odorant receptor 69a n=1 Tax=Drosophila teissieri TaxID=7243 RepID=UPI001CBA0160|nr:putative odorant receptor 69a [Drosophila teissieri]